MRVFITGASSGIGAAMAKKFDAMGAQLGLVGRSQEKLDAVLSGMHNAQAHTTYALDVTDRAALFAAARDFDGKRPWTSCLPMPAFRSASKRNTKKTGRP